MSADRNLGYAICLLALVTKGSPGSEEAAQFTQAIDSDANSPHDSVDDDSDDLDDLAMLSPDADPEDNLTEMGNQFLDRLAEILARFKAKPGTKSKQNVNAKHVCATMMVRYKTENCVKIFCAKNEGLDREDELFLEDWRSLMEDVSRKGSFQIPSSILS
ncbi:hypothetical protein N7533_001450 [Penicillium manginii]|uniref:uncharacterized protein n=1 Tax=Penicillium manginii TaxID=203109 RepID=UPI002549BE7E|nr:uncharacterized protein N7533_001450 [Penicillium manginii]KAJ5762769.1 hypothetical protein N7533_001450 [Penicillium manginii]